MDGPELFSIFVELVTKYIDQISPKACLKGGVNVSLVDEVYFAYEAILTQALRKRPSMSKLELLKVSSNTRALVNYLSHNKLFNEKYGLLLDFGHHNFRAYDIVKNGGAYEVGINFVSDRLSGHRILSDVETMIKDIYTDYMGKEPNSVELMLSIKALTKTYYPYVFKSYKEQKNLKITYNFSYPPFQGIATYERLKAMVEPYELLLAKIVGKLSTDHKNPNVIVIGNGFRMGGWPTSILRENNVGTLIEDLDGIAKGAALLSDGTSGDEKVIHTGLLQESYGLIDERGGLYIPLTEIGHHAMKDSKRVRLTLESKEHNIDLYSKDKKKEISLWC